MTAVPTPSSPRPAGLDRDNPWPGLASFTEQEAGFFHGRDGETADLLDIVRAAGLTVLFGKSGLGKSSLLRAGLFPRLRGEDYLPVAIRIDYGDAAPPPPEQVRLALQQACVEAEVEAPAHRPGESLWEYFHRKDADFWDRRNRLVTPVLVFDQFEELFTLGRSSDAARRRGGLLLEDLSGLVENRPPAALKRLGDSGDADTSGLDFGPSRCKVLLSLREDFLADLHKLKPLFPTILQNEIGLEAMSGSAAAEVVDESGGHLVAPGVTRRIVHFVAASATSGESPDAAAAGGNLSALKVEPALLSVVCSELNARRRERGLAQITAELLVDSRQGILADFFERGVSDLPPEARRFVEDRLLTRGGYRISVALDDALAAEGEGPACLTRELLDRLVSRRLLRIEERLGLQQVELTHDILAGPVRASRDSRRQREAAAAAAEKARQAAALKRRRRNRGAIGLALVVLCGAALVALKTWIEQRQQAAGLVQRLLDADTAQVPGIVGELAGYRRWADPLLRQEREKAPPESPRRLKASLGLLPVDPGQTDYLLDRLLAADPQEVRVIRDALLPRKTGLLDRLWPAALATGNARGAAGLRAASALALYDPQDRRWAEAAPLAADDLVREDPIFFGQWARMFVPVKASLLVPLSAIYRDSDPDRATERSLATNLLADYAADNPAVLADLLMDADEKQFAVLFRKVKDQPDGAAPVLTAEAVRPLLEAANDQKERLAKRQANAAVALLRLGHPAEVWPLLRHSPDPRARSYLVHRLAPLGADPATIARRLDEEQDVTIRRALVLSLGVFTEQAFLPGAREALLPKFREIYSNSEDPGLHAAAEWLLRQWKQEDWLVQTNAAWAKENRLDRILADLKAAPKPGPRWYVNGPGQTLVAIPGPIEVPMGSPPSEVGHVTNEPQHARRIRRTFALSAKAVTVEQFRALYKKHESEDYELPEKYTRLPNLPVVGTSWYQAALYCNWLSEEEGIPEAQWCYEVENGKVSKLKAHYLSLAGYRLPTEAEIEFATRAGAVTSRYYGETDELLAQYAWYFKNSQELNQPVGRRKPNDLGFFDLHGNTWTWCQERYKNYPAAKPGDVMEDTEDDLEIVSTVSRWLRGGSFSDQSSLVRSACRVDGVPMYRNIALGFRPARTLPLVPFTPLPLPPEAPKN